MSVPVDLPRCRSIVRAAVADQATSAAAIVHRESLVFAGAGRTGESSVLPSCCLRLRTVLCELFEQKVAHGLGTPFLVSGYTRGVPATYQHLYGAKRCGTLLRNCTIRRSLCIDPLEGRLQTRRIASCLGNYATPAAPMLC